MPLTPGAQQLKCGLSHRQSQRYANGTSPVADPVAKPLRLAIRIGLTANDLKAI